MTSRTRPDRVPFLSSGSLGTTAVAAFLVGLLTSTSDCRVDALIIPQLRTTTVAISGVPLPSSQSQQQRQQQQQQQQHQQQQQQLQQQQSKGGPPDFVMSREDVARLLLDGTNGDTRPYLGSYLPPGEAALQDKRLLECIQTTGPDFDQCFFFGTTDSMIDRMTTSTTTSSSSSSSSSSSASDDDVENNNINSNRSDESKSKVTTSIAENAEGDTSGSIHDSGRRRGWRGVLLPTTSSASIQSSSRTTSNRIPTW